MPIDPVPDIALRLALAGVIGVAGLHKLRSPRHYGAVVEAYRLLPRGSGTAVALALGTLEALSGLAILLPSAHVAGLLAAAGLFALYFVAIAVNLLRGRRDIDCGCGGPRQRQGLSGALLARNAVLVAVAVCLAVAAPAARVTGWFDWAVACAAAAALVLVYHCVDLLVANRNLLAQPG